MSELMRAGGSWCDLTVLPSGDVVWCYTSGSAVVCERLPEGIPLWGRATDQPLLYLRAAADRQGRICAIGQRHLDGQAAIVIDGGAPSLLGPTHGVYCVEIVGEADGWTAYVQRTDVIYDEVRIRPDGVWSATMRSMPATSQGFLEVRDGQVVTSDAGRLAHGLVLPNRAGSVWAGQHPQDPPTLALYDETTGHISRLGTGDAQPPHIVESRGVYYVCAYKTQGEGFAWLGTYTRPFPVTPSGPVEDTSGQPFDILPYMLPSIGRRQRTGSHDMCWVVDEQARRWWEIKFDNQDSWEGFNWTETAVELHEDRSQSEPGQVPPLDYAFTTPLWSRRIVRVGDIFHQPANVLIRFDPKSRTVLPERSGPHPYRMRVLARFVSEDHGGDVGVVSTVRLEYWPRYPHGNPEINTYGLGHGRLAWELRKPDGTLLNRTVFNRLGGRALTPTLGSRDAQAVWPPHVAQSDLRISGAERREIRQGEPFTVAYQLEAGPRPATVTWWISVNGVERTRTLAATVLTHAWTDLPIGTHPFGLRWPGGESTKPRWVMVRAATPEPQPEPSMLPDYPEWIDQLWPRFQREYRAARGHDPSTPEIAMWAYRVFIERWPVEAISADIAGRKPDDFAHATTPAGMPDYPTWQDVERPQLEQAARETFRGVVPLSTVAGASFVRLRDRRTLADMLRWVRGEQMVEEPIGPPGTEPDEPAAGRGAFAPVGEVSVSGKYWRDAKGFYYPLIGSCLYGIADGREPRDLLDQYEAIRVHGTRTFVGHLEGRNQTAESARRKLPQYLQWHRERGLKAEICAVTDSGLSDYDIPTHLREVAAICADYRDVVLGLTAANEFYHQTQRREVHDPDYLRSLLHLVPSGIPVAIGAPDIDELADGKGEWKAGTYPGSGGTYFTLHLLRDTSPGGERMTWFHEAARLREIAIIMELLNAAGANDEPNKRRNEHPGFYHLNALLGRGFNCLTTIHTEDGLQARKLSGGDLDAALWAVRGYEAFMTQTGPSPLEFHNARHGAIVREAQFFDPGKKARVWRTHGFRNERGAWLVLSGVEGDRWENAEIEFKGSWHVTGEIDKFVGPDNRSTILCAVSE